MLLPDRFSLKRRILSAGSWSLAGYALSNAIRLASSLVMTRLLVPKMFGVMAIATMVMVGLAMFSDVGLKQNIVQSKRGSDLSYLNTAWVIQIFRGFVLWGMALIIALIIFAANRLELVPKTSVYADPHLPYVIAVISIAAAVNGFLSTKLAVASRNLLLGRVTQMQISAQVFGLICMISWALVDRSIWALVAGYICSSVAAVTLSHLWLPGAMNRWEWDRSAFHEIIHFGKWIFLSSLLGFLVSNADRMLLGGFFDSTMLGIYMIAFTIFSSITQALNKIISDISFSALSEVARARLQDLKRSYYRLHFVIAAIAYVCSGILIFAGQNLIDLLYDPRYEQAGWMLEILAVALLAVPFQLVSYTLLALGKPKLFTQLNAISMVGTWVFVPLGYYFFGPTGAVWGVAASYFPSVPATVYYQVKHGLFSFSKEAFLLPAFPVGMIIGIGINYLFGH